MRVRDQAALRELLAPNRGYARAGRFAGRSRQFMWALANNPKKTSCSIEVGKSLEEFLGVKPGVLFEIGALELATTAPTPRRRRRATPPIEEAVVA